MDLDRTIAASIDIYVRAAELRSFRRAASTLGLTPSAVSKAISRLEQRLGVKLFERSTRHVSLTPEGATLLEYGRRALGELGAARARLSRSQSAAEGTVHLEAPPFIGRSIVAPALPALLRRHPGLVVHLALRGESKGALGERVDLAVRTSSPGEQELMVRRAGTLVGRALLCASPAYVAAAGAPRNIDDLRTHACLGFIGRSGVEPWTFATEGGALRLVPCGPFASTSKDALIDAAVRGVGIVRTFDRTVEVLLQTGALLTLLDPLAVVERQPVFVVSRSARLLPRRTRVVLDFLLELFASV